MAHEVGMRELRNHTSDVIDAALDEGEVILTRNGVPVAVIRPLRSEWDSTVDGILDQLGPAYDSGLAAILEDDDAASTEIDPWP